MWVIAIPIVLIILMTGYSFWMRKQGKEYFQAGNEQRLEEEQYFLGKMKEIAQKVQPNLDGKIIVNGQFIKSTKVGIKITTYYSYILLLDPASKQIQVIHYNPETEEASDGGYFMKEQIEAVDLVKGAQTNYLFKDTAHKQLFSVQTIGSEFAQEDDYTIKYPQEEAYNKLRSFFDLPPFQIKNHL
ncbi:hypothetical protein [Isobaculum melis]|uniref:Uncharacterized protein n=1 Tax=Isobaculum melis TaxID=142588 RepID=A0A1H9TME9_9LACT|nr:hypothetical protein [Isobaculum melis]SER97773.1 hypothetical protein SAMN04488559_11442 [Isobaculum melis]